MAVADTFPRETGSNIPLKVKLARAERGRKLKALGLVLPLFCSWSSPSSGPLVMMVFKSVQNEETFGRLNRTSEALAGWDGADVPDEAAFAALAADLKDAQEQRTAGEIAKRINYEFAGAQSKFKSIARKVTAMETAL
jgi:putative spermidine/putrescine transport system permease protein